MFKKKEIKDNTKRIAFGTYNLTQMPDSTFATLYKRMESRIKKAEDYQVPEWFNIRFVHEDKDIYEFRGSFHDGDEYPLVYKEDFLKILNRLDVEYEQIEENTYKIIRKSQ